MRSKKLQRGGNGFADLLKRMKDAIVRKGRTPQVETTSPEKDLINEIVKVFGPEFALYNDMMHELAGPVVISTGEMVALMSSLAVHQLADKIMRRDGMNLLTSNESLRKFVLGTCHRMHYAYCGEFVKRWRTLRDSIWAETFPKPRLEMPSFKFVTIESLLTTQQWDILLRHKMGQDDIDIVKREMVKLINLTNANIPGGTGTGSVEAMSTIVNNMILKLREPMKGAFGSLTFIFVTWLTYMRLVEINNSGASREVDICVNLFHVIPIDNLSEIVNGHDGLRGLMDAVKLICKPKADVQASSAASHDIGYFTFAVSESLEFKNRVQVVPPQDKDSLWDWTVVMPPSASKMSIYEFRSAILALLSVMIDHNYMIEGFLQKMIWHLENPMMDKLYGGSKNDWIWLVNETTEVKIRVKAKNKSKYSKENGWVPHVSTAKPRRLQQAGGAHSDDDYFGPPYRRNDDACNTCMKVCCDPFPDRNGLPCCCFVAIPCLLCCCLLT